MIPQVVLVHPDRLRCLYQSVPKRIVCILSNLLTAPLNQTEPTRIVINVCRGGATSRNLGVDVTCRCVTECLRYSVCRNGLQLIVGCRVSVVGGGRSDHRS